MQEGELPCLPAMALLALLECRLRFLALGDVANNSQDLVGPAYDQTSLEIPWAFRRGQPVLKDLYLA